MQKKRLCYSDSGVDIDKGNEAVLKIKELAESTMDDRVVSGIGGFGGLFFPGNRLQRTCVGFWH